LNAIQAREIRHQQRRCSCFHQSFHLQSVDFVVKGLVVIADDGVAYHLYEFLMMAGRHTHNSEDFAFQESLVFFPVIDRK
jgi:hypothetical protein